MPEVGSGRIETGTGNISYPTTVPPTLYAVGTERPIVKTVGGANIGAGKGLFAGTNGVTDVLLEFKSLMASNGIALTETRDAITLSLASGFVERFTDLLDAPDNFIAGGLIYGGTDRLEFLPPPTDRTNPYVLRWTGSRLEWATQAAGTVTRVSVVGDDAIRVSGSPVTSSGTIALSLGTVAVPGTYVGASIVVDRYGRVTSAFSNELGEINAAQNVGSGAGIFAGRDGSTLTFRSIVATGGITVVQDGNTVGLSIASSGVAPGTYSLPVITVDSRGRILQASARRLVGTNGVTITEAGGTIVIAAPQSTVEIANNSVLMGAFRRIDFSGSVQVTDGGNGTANVSIQTPPISAVANVGSGAPLLRNVLNRVANLRSITGGGGVTVTQQGDQIVVTGANPGINIFEEGAERATYATEIDFRGGITVSPDPTVAGRLRVNFQSAVQGGGNLGSGANVFLGPDNGTLQFRSVTAGAGIVVTEEPNAVRIAATPFTVTTPGATYTNVTELVGGSNITTTGTSGQVTFDFSPPPAPVSSVSNHPGSGARIFDGVTNNNAVFRRIVGGRSIAVTEGPTALVLQGFDVVGGAATTVTYDNVARRWTVSSPPVPTIRALDGTGGIGQSTLGAASGFGWSVAQVTPTELYVRRIVGTGGITVSTGGATVNGVASDIIIDASTYAAILQPSGVAPGTYSWASVTVDALGRITAAQSGSPAVTFTNAGTTGAPLFVTPGTTTSTLVEPGGTLSIRRIAATAPITLSQDPTEVFFSLAETGTAGTYNTPSVVLDNFGRIVAATSAPVAQGYAVYQVAFTHSSTGLASVTPPPGWTAVITSADQFTLTHTFNRLPASIFFLGTLTGDAYTVPTTSMRTVVAQAPAPGEIATDLAVSVTNSTITVHGITAARVANTVGQVGRVMLVL